ncbi:MAG: ethanolamine ammonia-lyase subunit EutC [Candidatus Acidiferrales bacterium]
MTTEPNASLFPSESEDIVRRIKARTPARLLAGRAGAAYRTETQLDLREAHAAARDAVRTELDLEGCFGATFVEQWNLFEVCTMAATKDEYLLRPDLGRRFSEESRREITRLCSTGNQVQIVIGDGLSVTAVAAQVPRLLRLLFDGAKANGWKVGEPFLVRHCRVGVLNDIGELLAPEVAVLLIGERPGLATAESLSAYLAYKPQNSHTDANRNLISNIHDRGVSPQNAAARILGLARQMMRAKESGCNLKEEFATLGQSQPATLKPANERTPPS